LGQELKESLSQSIMIVRKWHKFKQYFDNADCQLHTTYTDGKSSPEEYFDQAERNGLDFILFSEHVRRVTTYDYLKFKEHVYRVGAKSKVKFAVGAEAKVLDKAGNIDISDEILDEAEMVLFSFHTPYFNPVSEYIKAIKCAAANPITDVFAHPTMYHHWQKLTIDATEWLDILTSLSKEGVCYEFNRKYDLPGQMEIDALKQVSNLQYIFGSDAHHHDDLLTQAQIIHFKSLIL
jgi:histidinol phosphatase-like PHP family hydrolase